MVKKLNTSLAKFINKVKDKLTNEEKELAKKLLKEGWVNIMEIYNDGKTSEFYGVEIMSATDYYYTYYTSRLEATSRVHENEKGEFII